MDRPVEVTKEGVEAGMVVCDWVGAVVPVEEVPLVEVVVEELEDEVVTDEDDVLDDDREVVLDCDEVDEWEVSLDVV